jgi:L-alanine-DL-glutamate epimerase-like enolase superfamily enzyme
MKITDVTPIFVDRYLFVKVYTDAGIVGLGESGAWGYLEPSAAAIKKFGAYHSFFYEDPILPDNFDAMAQVAENIHIPIATGERLHTIYEFQALLARGAVQYVRPDVCMAGGLTHSKKIAALAEAHHVGVVPHNPLSPVSTAACLQLAACIPNFALQEYPTGKSEPPKAVPENKSSK